MFLIKLIKPVLVFLFLNSVYPSALASTIDSKISFTLSQSDIDITHLYQSVSITEEGTYDPILKNDASQTYRLNTLKTYRVRASLRKFKGSGTSDPFESIDLVLNGNQISSLISIEVDSSLIEIYPIGEVDSRVSIVLLPSKANGGIKTLKELNYESEGPMFFMVEPGEYEVYVKRGFSKFPAIPVSASKGQKATVALNTEFSSLNLSLDWSSLEAELKQMPIEMNLYLLDEVDACSKKKATNSSKVGSLKGQIEESFIFKELVLPATYCADIHFKNLLDGTTPDPFDFKKRRQLLKFENLEIKLIEEREQRSKLFLKSN